MLSMQIYNFSLKERREFQKNNVSLQLLVPISAIYSQIHIYLYTWQQLTTRRSSSQWWAYLRLSHKTRKQILKNIYLSFFYGAKIGIIGLNGAGKSTLMKIIAGLEQPTQGEVVWSPGYSVGYLPQDPPLDENKTVKENVMEGVQKIYDALAEYEDINNKFGLEEYYGDLIRWTS